MRESLLIGITKEADYKDVKVKVAAILKAILDNGLWLNDFYLHPLGFYYCRFLASETNQIRLHFWRRGYSKKEDLFIHDHFYDLCSWLLCGEIKDYTYEVKPTEMPSEYALFTSSYLANKDVRTITKTDQFMSVTLKNDRLIRRGEKYFIPRGSFHSNDIIFDNAEITFTCVFTYNHKDNNSPNVIGLAVNNEYAENNPIRLSKNEVIALITLALLNL